MTRLKANSRTASTTPMVTEITNGLIVTRPAKKFQEYNNEAKTTTDKEPEVIDLQEYAANKSKAASVPVNKLGEIIRFQMSNGRL